MCKVYDQGSMIFNLSLQYSPYIIIQMCFELNEACNVKNAQVHFVGQIQLRLWVKCFYVIKVDGWGGGS